MTILLHVTSQSTDYRIFVLIQDHLQKVNFDIYTFFLTSFNNYFSNKNLFFHKDDVQDLCFKKMIQEKDVFDEKLKQATTLKQMDVFIEWIFTD